MVPDGSLKYLSPLVPKGYVDVVEASQTSGRWDSTTLLHTDRNTIEQRRIKYDLETAQQKIRKAGLPDRLADRLRASIVLVHVVERIYAEGFLDTPAKRNVRTEAHRRAREKLDAVAESKSDHLVPIRHVVRHGVPKYEILRLAESMDVDLIILGRPPRNPLSRLVFGSVSRALVDTAPCPVVVVPAGGVIEVSPYFSKMSIR